MTEVIQFPRQSLPAPQKTLEEVYVEAFCLEYARQIDKSLGPAMRALREARGWRIPLVPSRPHGARK